MTINEMAQIMDILTIAYPQFYSKQTDEEKFNALEMWASLFADEPGQLVAMAVKAFITSDDKGFPPSIGQIKGIIGKMTTPAELEMSELEAWNLVRRAIRGASMQDWSRTMQPDGTMGPPSAVINFNRLPEILQRLVGDPSQLVMWEDLPGNQIDTVIQSNFMRSWRARAAHEKELLALPVEIREGMRQIAGSMKLQLTERRMN